MRTPEEISREMQIHLAKEEYAQNLREGRCPTCKKDDRRIQSMNPDMWECKRCKTEFGKSGMGSRSNKKDRVLPRGLRRAYRSENAEHIKLQIENAMKQGFTVAEIFEDLRKWKKNKEFIE